MLRHLYAWPIGGILLAFALLSTVAIDAAGKKKEEKPAPLLIKADELKPDDGKDSKLTKSPCKTYRIKLAKDKIYQFDLASKFFDAFLRLEDAAGKEVAFNDDADSSTFDSRIVYKATQAGDYKIIVASADHKIGKFNLTVTEADKKAILLTGSRFQGKSAELKFKDDKTAYRGELNEKDLAALQRYYKLFSVQLEKDKSYRFEGRADDPKTLAVNLFLEDADGTLLESSGFSKDVTARIVHKAAKAGSYRVIVTTRTAAQTGKLALEIALEK